MSAGHAVRESLAAGDTGLEELAATAKWRDEQRAYRAAAALLG